MKPLFPKLTERLKRFSQLASKIPVPEFANVVAWGPTERITHAWFWPRVGEWFKGGDVIVTETGMS
jgi:pyruvate decarboxylase